VGREAATFSKGVVVLCQRWGVNPDAECETLTFAILLTVQMEADVL
jgi:hypothetical protein